MESDPAAPPRSFARIAALWPLLLAVVVALIGWDAAWFFCDDAFINYRYCGNAHAGHGFVWNPPPFAPVEGYTSFLWVWLLWALWTVSGLDPTVTAIPISLASGVAVLWLVARAVAALPMPETWRPHRAWLAALVLLGIAGNHTFATWLSSGMETMLFALLAVAWTLRAMRAGGTDRDGLFRLAVLGALGMLTRPDGMLLVLGTLAMAAHAVLRGARRPRTVLLSLLPLLLPVVHLAWRRATYGEWLPNTYYAKVTTAWPESGLRYLVCFALENALYLWLPLAAAWLGVAACRRGAWQALVAERFPALTAVGVWLGYTGYYTLVVGGDHFAWRIFNHFVPLLSLSALAMAASLRLPAIATMALLGISGVAAAVPGWWLEAQLSWGRELEGFVRTAPHAPAWLRPVTTYYDRQQAWLLVHSVGVRRTLHATACALQRRELPGRGPGRIEGALPGMRLVWRADAVGVVGWALPDVAILDGHGLNDWVIARTRKSAPATRLSADDLRRAFPTLDGDADGRLRADEIAAASPLLASVGPQLRPATWVELLLSLGDGDGDDALAVDELGAAVQQMLPPRQMAHEREPPPGYIEALRPNVEVVDGVRRVRKDVVPLNDDEVREVEQRFRAAVQR